MPKKRHPELEGIVSQPLYTFELKSRRKTIRNRVSWLLSGFLLGIGIAASIYGITFYLERQEAYANSAEWPEADPFQQGSHQAMSAAELTQTAEYREDWSKVAILWQQAINNMRAVQPEHESYEIAQQKIMEYDRNLKYAQSNIKTRTASNPQQPVFWTIGSDRDLVLSIQGMPAQVVQNDSACTEVFYFGNSLVELTNGYVTEYSDAEGNLQVLADGDVALSIQGSDQGWTLGSSEADVFRIQGTPNRTSNFRTSVTLHYGNSSIDMENGRVVGYANTARNLKVRTFPLVAPPVEAVPPTWSLGSSRGEVLTVEQRPPTAIIRMDKTCEEIFHFENSTVVFRQGLVSEYSNPDQNLRIQP
jgi:hypothetical protein